ncbi:MAG: cell division protein SepF [Candidatus Woesearchaeota archaeon]
MKNFFLQLKDKLSQSREDPSDDEFEQYVELEKNRDEKSRVVVRPYVMEEFEDIKQILDALREGMTIALINIKPLKDKDIIELKRAINKLRKTCEAIEGDIAGFGDDYIVAVPYFAQIFRNREEILD